MTADGDATLFPLVEEIASQAPQLADWNIVALKPKRGFPKTARWEKSTVVISHVLTRPVFHRESGDLGLHLYVDGLTADNSLEVHNALLRALDEGLGERRFAECVRSTWVHPLSALPTGATSFPLSCLDDYLDHLDGQTGDLP